MARTGKGRGRKGAGLYPELAVRGISEGSRPALVSLVGRQCALLPSYQIARQELAARGPPLDIKVVHRIARPLGAAVLTSRTRDLLRWRAGALPPGSDLTGRRVAALIDGGRTRVRTVIRKQKGRGKGKKQRRRYKAEWREPKRLIIFEIDEQGRMKKKSRPWIDGTFAGPDEAMELLAIHLHGPGATQAAVVVFVADGAPWIWDRLDWVEQRVGLPAGGVVRVLDWCHAVHNLSLALEVLGLPEDERQRRYGELRGGLREGWWGLVLDELEKEKGSASFSACQAKRGDVVSFLMSRRWRCALSGYVYHALNRGAGRAEIFRKDGDYAAFEAVLAEAADAVAVRLLAYCLMPNHWHLVLWPARDGDLSRYLHWLTLTHTRRWHEHYHVTGTGPLYQGRYKSFPVQQDDHFFTLCRYVERNPLRAGLVRRAEAWRWSSLWRRARAPVVPWLADWPLERPADWVAWVNRAETAAELGSLRESVRRGCPYGEEGWCRRAAEALGLQSSLRPPGRPRKGANPKKGS